MTFDAVKVSQLLDGACGLEFHMQLSHEQAKAANALAGNADALIGTAILCVVAGRTDEAIELLNRAYTWLEEAISTDEKPSRYFPFETEAMNHELAGLAHWLLRGTEATEHQNRAVEMLDKYLASNPNISIRTLSLHLPTYLDAGRYQRVINLLTERKKWTVPLPEKGRWSAAEAAYFLAASRHNSNPPVEAIRPGIDSFLSRSIPTWMPDGQYVDAVRWIKIVRWNGVTFAVEPMALIRATVAVS